jgi:hypothetical protein
LNNAQTPPAARCKVHNSSAEFSGQTFADQRRIIMTQSKSSGTQNQQSGKPGTPSEAEAAAEAAGKNTNKSSHDHMSRERAGSHEGAGGGAKQKEHGH